MTLAALTTEFQRRVIEQVLAACGGDHRKAATDLGITRMKLSRLKRQCGLPMLPTQAWRLKGLPQSLRGIDPDFTGGMSTGEYIKKRWSGNG